MKFPVLKLITSKGARHTIAVIAMCALLLSACQKNKEDQVDAPQETEKVATYKQEVINVHDEAMAMMGAIYQKKKQLRERLNAASGQEKKDLESIVVKLDSADRDMRVWMREFSEVKTVGVPEDEALSNLKNEMSKITKVKDDMTEALRLADEMQKQ